MQVYVTLYTSVQHSLNIRALFGTVLHYCLHHTDVMWLTHVTASTEYNGINHTRGHVAKSCFLSFHCNFI